MKIFIATAMSGLTEKEYKKLQDKLIKIKNKSKHKIFSEITNISNQNSFLSPKEATEMDIKEIKKCDHFILLHLSNVQSSTLFELGIAYALKKKTTILYKRKSDLPFMLKELNKVSKKVTLKKMTKETLNNAF